MNRYQKLSILFKGRKLTYGIRKCETCVKDFLRKSGSQRFCSPNCYKVIKNKSSLNWYYDNLPKAKRQNKEWRKNNSERYKCLSKKYRERNRKKLAFLQRTRKYLKKSGGTHSLQEWENLKKKYGYMCLCCKRMEPEIRLTEDHIIPLYHMGNNTIDNIQPLCGSCNSRKNKNTIDYRDKINNCLKGRYLTN